MCMGHTVCYLFFFFKQKTAYEMRISDWSSDVCSSDLCPPICRNCSLACAYEKQTVATNDLGEILNHGCSKRSEEHTSELQSLMRSSYAVFCLNKKKQLIQLRSTYDFGHVDFSLPSLRITHVFIATHK